MQSNAECTYNTASKTTYMYKYAMKMRKSGGCVSAYGACGEYCTTTKGYTLNR